MTREYTNKLLDAVEEGMIDPLTALKAILVTMSEDEVKAIVECDFDFLVEEGEPDEEEEEK